MPETDKIVAELEAAFAGAGEADTRIAQAVAHANDVQARMIIAGFAGIAAGISEVVDTLGQVRTRLRAGADGLRATSATVQEIGGDTDPEHAAARLAGADQQMVAATAAVAAASDAMTQVGQRVATVLHGGQPGPLIAMINAAREVLTGAGQRVQAAREKTSDTIREARQAGK